MPMLINACLTRQKFSGESVGDLVRDPFSVKQYCFVDFHNSELNLELNSLPQAKLETFAICIST